MATTVKVKWGKEEFTVEVNPAEGVDMFRAQLFALTQVEPDRQKIMLKGKLIKDSWEGVVVKPGTSFLLMGTANELQTEPAEKIKFVEDMAAAEVAAASALPLGFENLGNTCYMNACLQCIHRVPELMSALQAWQAPAGAALLGNPDARLSAGLARLFRELDSTSNTDTLAAHTAAFLATLRQTNPRFAEMQQGHAAQQDAGECWRQMFTSLKNALPTAPGATEGPVDQLFRVGRQVVTRCDESAAEPAEERAESALELSCHMQAGFLLGGLQASLDTEVVKQSPTLGRDARYRQTARLTRLPAYLAVDLVRFYYKKKENTNCKVLKDVKFPLALDVFELCAAPLQQRLVPEREALKAWNDYSTGLAASDTVPAPPSDAMAVDPPLRPQGFPEDAGSNNSGYYELAAVLSHRGRSSDSGHYVAWVRGQDDQWYLFDDETVSPVPEKEILRLSGAQGGGADWHTAYILLYESKKIPATPTAP